MKKYKTFDFFKIDISNSIRLKRFLKGKKIDIICHLAAQAGVRYSLTNPRVYAKSNINGFLEILEYCRFNPKTKLVYASSSSVYGGKKKYHFPLQMMFLTLYLYMLQLKGQMSLWQKVIVIYFP